MGSGIRTGTGTGTGTGTVVVLNGVPRSGKSSIAAALAGSHVEQGWLNLGVDALANVIAPEERPGIGLRPGWERPDLEDSIVVMYDVLYATVAAWCRAGLNVVVDVGHHDDYSRPLGILTTVASTLADLPAYFVGVRCPVEVIMARRDAGPSGTGRGRTYVTSETDGRVPDIVRRWERAVHDPGLYDVEVDTSTATSDACVAAILRRVRAGPPVAFSELARAGT